VSVNTRARVFFTFVVPAIAAFVVAGCGSSSPTAPTIGSVSSVTLGAGTVAVGGTVQATIKLAAAATAAGTITVSSSNAAVASVPTSVPVAAGASTATATVTGVAPGSATITATLNGTSGQSAAFTVTAGAAVSGLTLSSTSVVGGQSVTGTVTLNAAAPAGGALVLLTTADPATVQANVTVAPGSASASFSIATRLVGGTIPATITASFGGGSASAVLSVTPPTTATANFGVAGPTESETCTMSGGATIVIDCTFNGSTSTAPGTITAYDWTYSLATTGAQTTSGPILTNPVVSCSFLPPPPLPAGPQSFTMTVTLRIHDSLGNVSALATDNGVRLLPQGVCGF
jgi:hypothetical protein